MFPFLGNNPVSMLILFDGRYDKMGSILCQNLIKVELI